MASSDKFLIHVRFAPDGTVTEISERPAVLGAQQWFDKLSSGAAGSSFQSLSGGRGVFRLTPDEIAAAKATAQQ
ncbi:MAG: hypothetical protein ACLPSF_14880 [Methylocella sp.]